MTRKIFKTAILIAVTTFGYSSLTMAQVTKWSLEERKPTTVNEEPTQYEKIGENIKSEFDKWLIKGEFEKNADYQHRVRQNSDSVFHDICLKQIHYFFYSGTVYEIQKKYQADEEYFDLQWVSGKNNLWKLRLDVPQTVAKRINHQIHHRDDYNRPNFTFTILNELNGRIVPQKAIFRPRVETHGADQEYMYELELYSIENQGKPLLYSTKSLQIKYGNLPLIIFDYNNVIENQEKTKREIRKQKQAEAVRKKEELALKEEERKKAETEARKAQEFYRSDYGAITKRVSERLNSSNADFSKNVDEAIDLQEKLRFKKMFYGKLTSYDIDDEVAIIALYDEQNHSFFPDGLHIKLPKTLAPIISENLKAYHSRGCCSYGGIIVIPNKFTMIDNYYAPSEATILFFLYDREQGMYGGSPLNAHSDNFDFSISRLRKSIRVFSKNLNTPYNVTGVSFTNLSAPKAINKRNLFYDWKISDNPNYSPDREQNIKQDLRPESLHIHTPTDNN